MISSAVESLWAAMTLIGEPTLTWKFSMASSPSSSRVLATRPRSLLRLYALSKTPRFSLEPVCA